MEYIRRLPQGSVMFMEFWQRTTYSLCMAAIAFAQSRERCSIDRALPTR